ncbi:MAG: methylmalonyl-CoA mutase small subunit [Propionibacteriaceae bacterium]|nr:methylmalonyl-CoA mutase small subunit [Propionibacteriaceae bacterium]
MAENDTLESQERVPDELDLGSVFPTPNREQWEAEVLKVLNRRRAPGTELPIEKALSRLRDTTIEGITIEPLYTKDDRSLGFPGVAPFDRGASIRSGEMAAWDVRQLHEDPDAAITRQAILNDLERGATSVWLRTGSDAISPGDLGGVLGDVLLDLAGVAVSSRDDQVAAAAALAKVWKDRGIDLTTATGNLGLDALALAATTGTAPDLAPHREWVAATLEGLPGVRALTVDVLPYHDAGASDADELGLAIATGVAYLRDLEEAGIAPADAYAQIEFRVSATADQFLTIARLRALRRLWSRVGEVVGIAADQRGARQHAVTSWRMMSRDDAYVNVLRATLACFSASVGGAEAITVLPFDTVHGLPNDFSRRIARNTQVILAEESNIARVNDPAGGSFFVEALTDQLAEAGWKWFQQIEAEGGMTKAVNTALITDRLAASTAERDRRLSDRSAPLTGVSMFPQTVEPVIERTPRPPAPESALPRRRDAEIFEGLRDRTEALAQTNGRQPAVLLAALGSRRDFGARETFTTSLLGVAGIGAPLVEGTDPDVFATGLKEAGTKVAVLCSSAKMYAQHGAAVAQALRDAGARTVLIAGNAKELGDAPEGTVDGALFAGVDTIPLLTSILDTLETAR